MIKKVAFTMYPVEDSDRARAFYEGVLGLSRGSHSPDGAWTEYDLPGGGCLALFKGGPGRPAADAGGTVALEVVDLDSMIQDLKSRDVVFLNEMVHSPVCRMSIISDSEGNAIILHQLDES